MYVSATSARSRGLGKLLLSVRKVYLLVRYVYDGVLFFLDRLVFQSKYPQPAFLCSRIFGIMNGLDPAVLRAQKGGGGETQMR